MNKWIRRGLFLLLTLAITAAGILTPRALLGRQEAALLGVSGTADGKKLRPYLDMKSNATRIALLSGQIWEGVTISREPLDTELSAGTAIELAKRYVGVLTEAIRRNCDGTWEAGHAGLDGQVSVSLLAAKDTPTMSAWIVNFGEISLGLDAVSGVPVMIYGMFSVNADARKETAVEYDASVLLSGNALWTALTEFYGELDGELFSFPEVPEESTREDAWQMHWYGSNAHYPIRLDGDVWVGGNTMTLSVWLTSV